MADPAEQGQNPAYPDLPDERSEADNRDPFSEPEWDAILREGWKRIQEAGVFPGSDVLRWEAFHHAMELACEHGWHGPGGVEANKETR